MIAVNNLHLDLTYTAAMADKTSDEYAALADKLEVEITTELKKKFPKVIGVQILSLKNGSVIVDLIVIYGRDSTTADALKTQLPTLLTDGSISSVIITKIPTSEDASKCSLLSPCSEKEDCVNYDGGASYKCKCRSGYIRKDDDCVSESLKDWMIAVIVIAVFVFILIVFVIISVVRMHRRQRSVSLNPSARSARGVDNMGQQS